MSKKKICVVITARPSYARVRSILVALKADAFVELQIVAAASFVSYKYGDASSVLEKDGFCTDWVLNTALEADSQFTAAKTTGLQTIELASVFQNLKPDLVITIADRYETMSTAVAASYSNIPLAHIQGGEVTGNIDEKVRHAITKMSDLHLVSNQDAYDRVLRLGEVPARVFNVGCPSIDIAREVVLDRNALESFNPFVDYTGVGDELDVSKPYLVVMQHPVTTEFGESCQQITATLNAVKSIDMQVFVMWPNPDTGTEGLSQGIRRFRELEKPKNFHFFKNMRPEDFLRLLKKSACLIGNSSVGIRECSYLGVPVVNIGTRQLDRQRGPNVIDTNSQEQEIVAAIRQQLSHGPYARTEVYGDGLSGAKAAQVLRDQSPPINKRIMY